MSTRPGAAPAADAARTLAGIDWQPGWLDGWRVQGRAVQGQVLSGATVAQALEREALAQAQAQATVRFVSQSSLPPGMAYEQFIFESGTVPTRDNLHDFFNGLCWMRFPATKQRLNRLQAAEISAAGVTPLRGPVRDALTVFDENAAFLLAPPPLWDALATRDWRRLFVDLRPLWAEAQLVLFGHALLEKLVDARKPITAHVYRAQPAIDSIAELDAWIAGDLSAAKLAAKPFLPMPVLGVPGWWPENENFSFYDDPLVFRPARPAKRTRKPRVPGPPYSIRKNLISAGKSPLPVEICTIRAWDCPAFFEPPVLFKCFPENP